MVGLDGCAGGWVVVELVDGRVGEVAVVAALADAFVDRAVSVAGVDIPIGLDDVAPRPADVAARRLLGRRASSVFDAPVRSVVDGYRSGELTDHAAASALSVRLTGRGVSVQTWRLVPRIAEADVALAAGLPVVEVHPEVAFATLVGRPLARKTSWAGLEARRGLLAALGLELPDRFPGADRCAPDDVVDAAICAWVADGLAADDGSVEHVPADGPPPDTLVGAIHLRRGPRSHDEPPPVT